MKFAATLLVALLTITLASCNQKERYAANGLAADDWIAANGGIAGMNVTGSWQSHEFGWGGIRFIQSGSTVTGAMGNYSVKGVVNGQRLYLALSSGGWVYYTMILQKEGSNLAGFYSSSIPFSTSDQAAVTLARLTN